jgi:hypothetical protein
MRRSMMPCREYGKFARTIAVADFLTQAAKKRNRFWIAPIRRIIRHRARST